MRRFPPFPPSVAGHVALLEELRRGALVDLANPKIILFYAAFLPTFADLDNLAGADIALMAALVVAILPATNLGFAWLASIAAARSKPSTARRGR